MDDHFYNNNFEKFLQQQVKQHRMYPSDAVWKGIYKQVHGNKKWPGLYFIAILMVAALSVCTIFIKNTPIVYPNKITAKSPASYDHLNPVAVTDETLKNIGYNHQTAFNYSLPSTSAANISDDELLATEQNNISATNNLRAVNNQEKENIDALIVQESNSLSTKNTTAFLQIPGINENKIAEQTTVTAEEKATAKQTIAVANTSPIEQTTKAEIPDETAVPVVISKHKNSRWQYQVYITPASTYKQTIDKKASADVFNGPLVTTYGVNASEVIRYKPGMGVEFGFGVLYSLNNRLRLKGGFQYNIRQYNIEAYEGNTEVTRINLASGSITTTSKYRSAGGNYDEALLLNKYHQVSLPVGIEYSLINGNRLGINIGATVQPTYTFSQSSYLLTADYKSYADGTSMIRRWNLNSSLETTLSYKVGDFQWKLGPQLRYQHFSTYSNKYPIKEFLIDYGFKIGFTKTIH